MRIAAIVVVGMTSALIAQVGSARAAYLNFRIGENVARLDAGDFERGLNVNGRRLASGIGDSGSIHVPLGGTIAFAGGWIDNGLTPRKTRTAYVVGADGTTLVGLLTYRAQPGGTVTGSLATAVGGDLGTLPAGVAPRNVAQLGDKLNANLPFLTIPVVTPLPAALPLLGAGLAGLAWWRRRASRAARPA